MSQDVEIRFQYGKPYTFVATRSFALGNTNIQIIDGMTVSFDGTTVEVDGFRQQMPQLRGAVRQEWLVLAEDYDPDAPPPRPQPAGVEVRHATQGGNPMDPNSRPRQVLQTDTEENEREVANVNQHAAETRDRNRTNYRREPVGRRRVHGSSDSTQGERFQGDMGTVESQDGIPVRQLQTPAKQDTTVTPETVGSAISRADKVKIQPGQPVKTEESLLANLTPEEREDYLAEKASRRAQYAAPPETQVVGRVPSPTTQQKEGFTIKNEVGGGIETFDGGGTGGAGKEQQQTVEEGGIKFQQTNGPKKGVRVVDAPKAAPRNDLSEEALSAQRTIAKSICPDFPENYDFAAPARKKIARLQADYDDNFDVIRAVAAAESDSAVKQRLVQEWPEAFASA